MKEAREKIEHKVSEKKLEYEVQFNTQDYVDATNSVYMNGTARGFSDRRPLVSTRPTLTTLLNPSTRNNKELEAPNLSVDDTAEADYKVGSQTLKKVGLDSKDTIQPSYYNDTLKSAKEVVQSGAQSTSNMSVYSPSIKGIDINARNRYSSVQKQGTET